MEQKETFKARMIQLECAVEGHDGNIIVGVCIDQNCKHLQKAVCIDCYDLHIEHRNQIISTKEIENIIKDNEKLIDDNENTIIPQMQIFKQIKDGIIKLLNDLEKVISRPFREIKKINALSNFSHVDLNQLSEEIGQVANAQNKQLFWKVYEENQEATNELVMHIDQEIRARLLTEAIIKKFSQQYKAPEVILKWLGSASECTKTQKEGSNESFWCLSMDPVSNTLITNFKIRIKEKGQKWSLFGLGSKSVMQSNLYFLHNLLYSYFFIGLTTKNRGLYVIFNDGRAIQESKDKVQSTFKFITGDIIDCQYDPTNKVLFHKFIVNNINQKLVYTFDVDGKETDLHLVVGYSEQGQSLEIMAP